MEKEKIKELASLMEEMKLSRLSIKEKDCAIELERGGVYVPAPVASAQVVEQSCQKVGLNKEEGNFVTSPMVGTFYSAPSPDQPCFVKVGDHISEGTVICIVEAMKVMNEVKSSVSGIVEAVLIENGHPVEFGTKLIRVK